MYRPEDIPLRANVDLSHPIANQDHWFKVYRHDFRYYNLHLPYAETLPETYMLRHLIALIGVKPPTHFHGRDLSPLCRGEAAQVPTHAIVETGGGAAIRTLSHLYHLPFVQGHDLASAPSQYYNLVRDPFQMCNLAEQDRLPPPAGELDDALRRWNTSIPWMATT
jgi:hypothetical protein